MLDSGKRRLERLADDAYELSRLPGHVFGFILIVGPNGTRIRDENTWLEIGKYNSVPGDMYPVWMRDFRVDPDPYEARCVWWWGDHRGVDRLKDWAERMSLILTDDSTLLGGITAESGLCGALCALCKFAGTQPELSDLIRDRVAEVGNYPNEKIPKNKVYMLHVIPEGGYFAHVVASYLLGQSPRGPRLTVDVQEDTVTLDGKTYSLENSLYVDIVDELVKGKGGYVPFPEMAKNKELIRKKKRLDRIIKQFKLDCPKIGMLIESAEGKGYRIPKEYLT